MLSSANYLVTGYDRKVKEGKAVMSKLKKENGVLKLGGNVLRQKIVTLEGKVAELDNDNKALIERLGMVQTDLSLVTTEKDSLESRADSRVAKAKAEAKKVMAEMEQVKARAEKVIAEAEEAKAKAKRVKESGDRLTQLAVKSALEDLNGKYDVRFKRIRRHLKTEKEENDLHSLYSQAKGLVECLEFGVKNKSMIIPLDFFIDLRADVVAYEAKYKAFETIDLEDGDLKVIPIGFSNLPSSDNIAPEGLSEVNQVGSNIEDVTPEGVVELKDPPNMVKIAVELPALTSEPAVPPAETTALQTAVLLLPVSELEIF